jgi:hypothetical protein
VMTWVILTELSGAVERKAGYPVVSASGADVGGVLVLVGEAILSKESDSLGTTLVIMRRRDAYERYTPKETPTGPQNRTSIYSRVSPSGSPSASPSSITSIIDDSVKTTKMLLGRRERSFDLLVVRDVELSDRQLPASSCTQGFREGRFHLIGKVPELSGNTRKVI